MLGIYDQRGLLDAAIKPCISNLPLPVKPCVLYLTSRADESHDGELAFAIEGEALAFGAEGEAARRRYAGKVACCHPHGADMSATLQKRGKN